MTLQRRRIIINLENYKKYECSGIEVYLHIELPTNGVYWLDAHGASKECQINGSNCYIVDKARHSDPEPVSLWLDISEPRSNISDCGRKNIYKLSLRNISKNSENIKCAIRNALVEFETSEVTEIELIEI